MSEETASTGETAGNFIDKITPKDLVMFSPATRKIIAKNDFSFLGIDYDLQIQSEEEKSKIRIWGIPYFPLEHPLVLGAIGGSFAGVLNNLYRKRPVHASIQVHILSGLAIALVTAFSQAAYQNYRIDRELVTWDYVKKHPQDFPEVFNQPKKLKDMVLPWRMSR